MDISFPETNFSSSTTTNFLAAKLWTDNFAVSREFLSSFPPSLQTLPGPVAISSTIPGISLKNYPSPPKTIIVALHGYLDNSSSFDLLAPALTRSLENSVIIALDLAGHGWSYHGPRPYGYFLHHHAHDVHQILKLLNGFKEFILMGHSMGGAVSTMLSACYPDQIRALILLENLGPWSRSSENTTQSLRNYYDNLEKLPLKQLPIYKFMDDIVKKRQEGTSNGTISWEGAQLLALRGLRKIERNGKSGWTWRTDQQLVIGDAISFSESQALQFLKDVKSPSLLILGNQGFRDMYENKKNAGKGWAHIDWLKRRSAVKGIKVEHFDGGHHLHLDSSTVPHISQSIANFIRSLDYSKSSL